jgi:crotonobetainyl-CoA:carnitine CoA-transferase CaiB-like acyl-CoA transferase
VYVAIFAGLTTLAAVSFIGQVRATAWRRWATGAMWAALACLAALYAWSRGSPP